MEQPEIHRSRLEHIAPDALVFMYVNPCPKRTRAWNYGDMNKDNHRHNGSVNCVEPLEGAFKRYLKIWNPVQVRVYTDRDVMPPARRCWRRSDVPIGLSQQLDESGWQSGTYQQYKGIYQCYQMVKNWEARDAMHPFAFDVIIRLRADSSFNYCPLHTLDLTKMHYVGRCTSIGCLSDKWAILPRSLADAYFNTVEDYDMCYNRGRLQQGEFTLTDRLWKRPINISRTMNCSCLPVDQAKYVGCAR